MYWMDYEVKNPHGITYEEFLDGSQCVMVPENDNESKLRMLSLMVGPKFLVTIV